MKSRLFFATGSLVALLTVCGSAVLADSHAAETPAQSQAAGAGRGAQAGPSKLPAAQADVNAVTSPNLPVDQGKVGNQQATPSQAPAPHATTEAVKQKP